MSGAAKVPKDDRDLRRFAWLAVQLGALLALFKVYALESPAFVVLAAICFAGFAVHYWMPARHRGWFFVAYSMAAAPAVLGWLTVLCLFAVGLVFYLVLRAPLPFVARLASAIALGVGLMLLRAAPPAWLPAQLWPVLGGIFMFRMIVYVYDLRHATEPPRLLDYLGYFYLLPNYYFLLFPVVDYRTFLHVRGRGERHAVAQTGIHWICRGSIQLLLYRLVEHYRPVADPTSVTSLAQLLAVMFTTYLLYLKVSGQFHVAIGMLRLFGFDLPETHRRYLLASSIPDFWRRINIYWKDFIAKVAYFPAYFALRRRSEALAMVVATTGAFTLTWALHSYQWFWLRGEFLLTWPDTLFWAVLGALMLVSLLWEQARRKRSVQQPARAATATPSAAARVRHAASVATTLLTIMVLWSLWQSPSVGAWLDLVTYWSS